MKTNNFAGRVGVGMLSAAMLLCGVAVPAVWAAETPVPQAAAAAAHAPDLVGNWQGTLAAGKGLRIVLRVSKVDGKLKADFYSIDQSPQPVRVTSISLQGTAVTIEVKPFNLVYAGVLSPDGKTIIGKSTQGSQSNELDLQSVTDEAMWPIPEAPKPMAADANPAFDVATIKPARPDGHGKGFGIDGRTIRTFNTSLTDLIVYAYDVQKKQIVNGPEWIDNDRYEITGVPDVEGAPNNRQVRTMIQKLLADRFQLKFHHDTRELSVYILSVAKGGPKNLTKSDSKDDGFSVPIRPVPGGFTMPIRNALMTDFTGFALQGAVLDRPVLDHTGITGRYDFTLTWAPLGTEFEGTLPPPAPTDNPPPGLFTAMQEQLGLVLTPTKAPADVMVIDKAEKPSAN
jgi:uncharacterized protein (TIGR03435 family)